MVAKILRFRSLGKRKVGLSYQCNFKIAGHRIAIFQKTPKDNPIDS